VSGGKSQNEKSQFEIFQSSSPSLYYSRIFVSKASPSDGQFEAETAPPCPEPAAEKDGGLGLAKDGGLAQVAGLLLVGHGTRDARGLAEFQTIAWQVAGLADGFLVEACYLELAEPSIATAMQRLLERGVRRVTVAPLLLFAAGHAKRDIPEEVEAAVMQGGRRKAEGGRKEAKVEGGRWKAEGGRKEFGVGGAAGGDELVVDYVGALECHEKIVELSARQFEEAMAGRAAVDAAETLLILVGRGSSDAEAIGAMKRFAELRAQRTPVGQAEVCFVAVAKPTLDEMLERAARSDFRRIVVQPHLLFAGEVLETISDQWSVVSEQERGFRVQGSGTKHNGEWGMRNAEWGDRPTSDKEWILAGHLGASELVAEAVMEMVRRRHLA
jgi:sirohydrochlorin cobaltochelatase